MALSMFVYGIAKTVQFDATSGNDAPLNSLTGQQLMWAFYGYSLTYAKFLGVIEMGGALLLLFRRTTLLGCAVLTTVLLNIIFQDVVFHVNAGALRAAIIYQVLLIAIVVLQRDKVKRIWQAFMARDEKVDGLAWYWTALGAAAVLALTLSMEHFGTH